MKNRRLDVKLGNGNGVKVNLASERRHQEDQVISNYLSKLESYHKNKIKVKALESMKFEAEGRELETVLGRAKVKSMDQFRGASC